MPMIMPRLARSLACGLLPAVLACQEPSVPPAPLDGTEGPPPPTTLGTADDTAGETDTETGGTPTSCDDIVCQDNAGCLIEDGIAGCYCDEGYVLDEEGGDTCVVDTSCIELRYLEDRCRYIVSGPPAVTLFFAVDYCAGTAVLPEDLDALGLHFEVLENGIPIDENAESVSTVIEKDVESYVTLVLDVSDSVIGTPEEPDPDLPLLVGELQDFVAELAPAPGQPDVYVSIYLFGRFVVEYVPFTNDYAALDASIAAIEPLAINTLVNGDGTRLYDATATGIRRTQRIRDLRDAVTWGGVLTTGTVVVITDGLESTNGTLDTGLINDTLNQVISIGISEEVTANDEALREIGRDGSFLAPAPEDWAGVFDQVVARVKEYPERAYLLGYCTSAAQGIADVEVTLQNEEGMLVPVKTATCDFDASLFSVDPTVTCSLQLFETECDEQPCGGLTACGMCASDECCDGRQCEAPVDATLCDADQLCNSTGRICVEGNCVDPDQPGGPAGVGDLPCDPGCDPGATYCDYDDADAPVACEPAMPVDPSGPTCDEAAQCQSLNCRSANPDNEFVPPTCLLPALVHDDCGPPGFTVCEVGSWCSGSTCKPQQFPLTTCASAEQCRSGVCSENRAGNVCDGSGVCYWAWNEKVPDPV
jgi:hypothetical protein